jgi:hypothetical protein
MRHTIGEWWLQPPTAGGVGRRVGGVQLPYRGVYRRGAYCAVERHTQHGALGSRRCAAGFVNDQDTANGRQEVTLLVLLRL